MIDNSLIELHKVVDENIEALLNEVERFCNTNGAAATFGSKNDKVGRNQFQALAQAAREAASTKEIKAYIAYQVGRESQPTKWATMCGDKTFGTHLINSINNVERLINDNDPLALQKRLALVERFLGFLYWRATVEEKATRAQNNNQHSQNNNNRQQSHNNRTGRR